MRPEVIVASEKREREKAGGGMKEAACHRAQTCTAQVGIREMKLGGRPRPSLGSWSRQLPPDRRGSGMLHGIWGSDPALTGIMHAPMVWPPAESG